MMVKTPHNGSSITREWLEVILGQYESRRGHRNTVEVTSFQVAPGANPREHFSSQVAKVKLEALVTSQEEKKDNLNVEDKTEGNAVNKEGTKNTDATRIWKYYNLVTKFLVSNPWDQEWTKYYKNHLREFQIYSSVIPELNRFQATATGDKYHIQLPEFIYGLCEGDEYVLVMEDLRARGYRTLDRKDTLDLERVLMAVDGLARVHAISHAYDRAHNFLERYPDFCTKPGMVTHFTSQMSVVYDGLIQALRHENGESLPLHHKNKESSTLYHKNGNFSTLLETMVANRDAVLCKFKALYHGPEQWVECLTHADVWVTNLMYRDAGAQMAGKMENDAREGDRRQSSTSSKSNNTKEPVDLIIIDWADLAWRNPIFDLQELIFTSTSRDFRKAHLEEVQSRYFSTFATVVEEVGTGLGDFSFQDFLKEWRRTSLVGMMVGFMHALVILSDGEEIEQSKEESEPSSTAKERESAISHKKEGGSTLSHDKEEKSKPPPQYNKTHTQESISGATKTSSQVPNVPAGQKTVPIPTELSSQILRKALGQERVYRSTEASCQIQSKAAEQEKESGATETSREIPKEAISQKTASKSSETSCQVQNKAADQDSNQEGVLRAIEAPSHIQNKIAGSDTSSKSTQEHSQPSLRARLTAGLARMTIPLLHQPVFQFVVRATGRRELNPMIQELMSGRNKLLNTTVYDLLTEAQENGVFQI